MKAKAALIAIPVMMVLVLLAWQTDIVEAQIATDGLVSYWSFDRDDIEDKTVKDLWGDNDGTIEGRVEIVPGKIGEALEFHGWPDCVRVKDNESLALSDEVTLEAWVNVTQFVTNGGIITKGTITPRLQLLTVDGGRWKGVILSEGGWVDMYGSDNETGLWYHLAMVVDERGPEGLIVYCNGEPVGEPKDSSGVGDVSSDGDLVIGWDEGGWKEFYRGIIDEVRIYNRALTDEEIEQNMKATKGLAVSPAGKLALTWGGVKVSE